MAKPKRAARGPRKHRAPRSPATLADRGEVVGLAGEIVRHSDTTPALTGGDVDADWLRAGAAGDEAVGGSVATPDQDVVSEIGEALGVGREEDEEFRTSDEILRERDRARWELEGAAADEEEGRRRWRS
jgi:hypothetical protein